jgi:hypothetical protein
MAIGLGALIKMSPIVAAPLVAVRALRERRLAGMLVGVLAVVAAAACFWWQFFRDPAAFAVARRQSEVCSSSIAWAVRELTGAPVGWLSLAGRTVVVAVVAAWCVRLWRLAPDDARRGEQLAAGAAASLLALALAGTAMFGSWYHTWWLPLAFASRSPFLWRMAIATTCVALLGYLPWTGLRLSGMASESSTLCCGVLAPLALALGWPRRGTPAR